MSLLCYSYNLNSNNTNNQLSALSVSLDIYPSFIVLGNFNVEVENRDMEGLCNNYNLKSLIRVPEVTKTKITLYVLISY